MNVNSDIAVTIQRLNLYLCLIYISVKRAGSEWNHVDGKLAHSMKQSSSEEAYSLSVSE
jgi:hypothetical protein